MTKLNKVLGAMALAVAGSVHAAPGLVTNAAALGATDSVNWAQLGAEGDAIGQSFSALSGNSLAISGMLDTSTGSLAAVGGSVVGWSAGNGFNAGDAVLWAEDANGVGAGPLTLSFNAVRGAGLYVQSLTSGAYTMQIDAYNGSSLLNSFSASSSGDGMFIGVLDNTADITGIKLHLTSCAAGCDTNDFAVNSLQLNVSAVPEPTTWSMLLLGGAALPFLRRRKNGASLNNNTGSKA